LVPFPCLPGSGSQWISTIPAPSRGAAFFAKTAKVTRGAESEKCRFSVLPILGKIAWNLPNIGKTFSVIPHSIGVATAFRRHEAKFPAERGRHREFRAGFTGWTGFPKKGDGFP
jgi:hypothetical protein